MLQLVAALPQRALRRLRDRRRRGLRLRVIHPWQQTHREHRSQHRASAEGQQCQQHHRRQQPEAFVTPLLAFARPLRAVARVEYTERTQIAVIGRDARIAAATGSGDCTQAALIQRGLADLPIAIAVGRTGRRAQAQHRHCRPRLRACAAASAASLSA